MQKITSGYFIVVLIVTFALNINHAYGQGNDCATATLISPGAACTPTAGTTVGSTQSIPAITCNGWTGNADDDVWYRFVATATAHTITVTGSGIFDPVIELRSGTCNGTNIACADSTFGGQAEVITAGGLTIGSTYYVRIYSYGGAGSQGTFTICVTTAAAGPSNDNCAGATVLTVNAGTTCTASTAGTTVGATQSQVGCAGTADDDVWFRFTATAATHQVTVSPTTLSDVVFQVFSGTCAGTLTSLVCQDLTAGTTAETATLSGLAPGTTYFVRVYSYGGTVGNRGTFNICITTPVATSNDNCAGAILATVNPGLTCTSTTAGTTIGATQSMIGCSGSADDDVWFRFVATGPNHTVTITTGTLYDAVFEVFSGACGTLTSIACIDNTVGTGNETSMIAGLTAGNTYYIRVYSYYNFTGDNGTFTLCITTPAPLTNDNCSGAIALTVNPTESCISSTTGSTVGASQSMIGCFGTADDDVWYSFVATSTTHTITSVPGTIYDAVLEVFSGTCGTLTSVACIDNTIGFGTESAMLTGLTIGATYFVRVYTYFAYAGDNGTFTLCITTSTPCTAGPGTGTTDLGCPSVVSGGLGLNGSDPTPLDCTSGSCVDLEATYLQLGRTTDYTVESIPYAPPYQFECLANPVSVNVDDIWSPIVNLPFNFCFYGNTYNQCLISSNGVITFDLASNTPGGSSDWSFSENLPNTNLFLNTIFGVYHDIDPSIGGDVGWELITLNTGCRALVAAWNDIPMFSFACNSSLYSGMIVLYENTNIIDIYIQEKNVCSSWNGGNAIVGLQNATGSMAIAAPGRNGLDADWTVTNEAWRFVPSGTPITSLKWYEGAGTGGPMIGTSDVISVCPSSTTTYTAEVTYTLCNGATLIETETTTVTIDKNKVWNGSVSTDWFTAANWTPVGVPNATNCILIPDVVNNPIVSSAGITGVGYSLTVENGGVLTVNPGNNLYITDLVEVQSGGTFDILNSGSLIQTNNVANIGSINMQRITQPMHRYDFTYWNSPVTLSSNFTLGNLSPQTLIDKYFSWTPTQGGSNGIWIYEPPGTVMDPTKGYIIRAPQSFSSNPAVKVPYTGTFTGTPNNGNIICPVSYGTMGPAAHEDKWNLLGNPYPSAVSAAAFLNHPTNAAILDGTIYFWTHNTTFSTAFPDPFYGTYAINYTASDYASWNKTGGVGTIASSGGPAPNGYIAAGQSFFAKSLAVPGSAIFTNSMRVTGNNTQFFRASENTAQMIPGEEPLERHRIWLNMTNETGSFNQLLIGYVEGATLGYDRGLDGTRFSDSDIMFYSIIPDDNLVIQGRPLPFDMKDRVPLGYVSSMAGEFSIKIDHIDGLFNSQNIYLEDKALGIIHNLKESPYQFITEAGTFDQRFVLRYVKAKPSSSAGILITAVLSNHNLSVRTNQPIVEVDVYDVAGKLVRSYQPAALSEQFNGDFYYDQGIYFVKVKCTTGDGTVKLSNTK